MYCVPSHQFCWVFHLFYRSIQTGVSTSCSYEISHRLEAGNLSQADPLLCIMLKIIERREVRKREFLTKRPPFRQKKVVFNSELVLIKSEFKLHWN